MLHSPTKRTTYWNVNPRCCRRAYTHKSIWIHAFSPSKYCLSFNFCVQPSFARLILRLLSVSHLILGVKYRTWYFTTAIVMGGLGKWIFKFLRLIIGEIVGYIGRVGSAYDVTFDVYFIIQICCLIFAPAFYSAALYWTIGVLYFMSQSLILY